MSLWIALHAQTNKNELAMHYNYVLFTATTEQLEVRVNDVTKYWHCADGPPGIVTNLYMYNV